MKTVTLDRSTTNIFVILMSLYLLAEFQLLTPLTAPLRLSFISVVLIIGFYIVAQKKIRKEEFILFIPAILFQSTYILNSSTYTDGLSHVSITYQAIFLLLAYIVTMISWKKGHIQVLSLASIALTTILLAIILLKPDLLNLNAAGAYAYLLLFFILLYPIGYSIKNPSFLFLIAISSMSLIAISMSDARSIFISLFAGLFTLFVWKFITKTKFRFNAYFILLMIGNYAFTVIYPRLNVLWNDYAYYNMQVIKYTGKSILSGRQDVWTALIELIKLKPFFGYGSGALPKHFLDTTLSSHNLYLQVTLQVGLVGLGLLLVFLFFIWNSLWKNQQDPKVILVACFFIGILVYQLFEVTLTQNNFGITILQWIIIGLGLSFVFNKKQEEPSE